MTATAHRRGELRSLAYHRAIAARFADEPEVLQRARARVEDWLATSAVHRTYAERWRQWLALPLPQLTAHVLADDEHAAAMRQVSPFAGALNPRERWRLWRNAAATPGAGEPQPQP